MQNITKILIFIGAIVFLSIILPLINQMTCIGCGNFRSHYYAIGAIEQGVQLPGRVSLPTATFTGGDILSSNLLGEDSFLEEDQICVLLGASMFNSNFEYTNGKSIKYTGSYNTEARLLTICDETDKIEGSVNEYNNNLQTQEINLSECSTLKNSRYEKYCVVTVIRI